MALAHSWGPVTLLHIWTGANLHIFPLSDNFYHFFLRPLELKLPSAREKKTKVLLDFLSVVSYWVGWGAHFDSGPYPTKFSSSYGKQTDKIEFWTLLVHTQIVIKFLKTYHFPRISVSLQNLRIKKNALVQICNATEPWWLSGLEQIFLYACFSQTGHLWPLHQMSLYQMSLSRRTKKIGAKVLRTKIFLQQFEHRTHNIF